MMAPSIVMHHAQCGGFGERVVLRGVIAGVRWYGERDGERVELVTARGDAVDVACRSRSK